MDKHKVVLPYTGAHWALKRGGALMLTARWTDPENTVLTERSRHRGTYSVWFHWWETSRTGRSTDRGLVVVQVWGRRRQWHPLQYPCLEIPWMKEPGGLQSMGSRRVGHDWATSLSLSCTGEGNGNPLQCSYLENPRDGGAWWAAVYGVAQSRTQLKWLSSSSKQKLPNLDEFY